MSKFRKKPIVVEALKWTGRNVDALCVWAAQADVESKRARGVAVPPASREVTLPIDVVSMENGYLVEIRTPEGVMAASAGDYIICGVHGEFYPCKPDIFEATYEAVK